MDVPTLGAALTSDDPDATVRAISRSPNLARVEIEAELETALLSQDPIERRNAGLGAYALTVRATGEQCVSAPFFERLVAAAMVETDDEALLEILIAMTSQNFESDLRPYASLVARIAESHARLPVPVAPEVLSRFSYVYEKLKRQAAIPLPDVLKIVEREPVGYAATGLLFELRDRQNPTAVLVYNRKLDAWLPPGGHFDPAGNDVPTLRLLSKIRRETGAGAQLLWNAPEFGANHSVRIEPNPSFVLFEDLRSMRQSPMEVHGFHYDFNYICEVVAEQGQLGSGTHTCLQIPLGGTPSTRGPLRVEVQRRIEEAVSRLNEAHLNEAQVLPDVVERIALSLTMLRDFFNREQRTEGRLWRLQLREQPESEIREPTALAAEVLGSEPVAVKRRPLS